MRSYIALFFFFSFKFLFLSAYLIKIWYNKVRVNFEIYNASTIQQRQTKNFDKNDSSK